MASSPAHVPAEQGSLTLLEALARMSEAEDTLRALRAGEIDAFVVSEAGSTRQVFTLTTADRPYRMFVENMREGAATLSEGGLILYANGRLIELLLRDRSDVVGSPLTSFVSRASRSDLEHVRVYNGVSLTIEIDLINSAGQKVPVLVGISPLEVDGSTLSCLTFTDLTDQKAQEREIKRLHLDQADRLRQLQAAQAALTEQATQLAEADRQEERAQLEAQLHQARRLETVGLLAGGIAHDFNNLLAAILACCSLATDALDDEMERRGLRDDEDFASIAQDVGQIAFIVERAVALTRQLLIFSRRQPSTPVVLDVNAAVTDLQVILRRTMGEQVLLELDLDPHLPAVKADRSQIEQVCMNLVVNARDAVSGSGRVTIRTSTRHIDGTAARATPPASGRYVVLSVSDDGMGMDADVLARALEPFFSTKGPGEGSGLGLATVYGIATQAGGQVDITSSPAHGTTVCVLLPATDEPLASAEAAITTGPPRGGGQTILVVEDDAAVREPIRRALARYGYRVLVAADAQEATAEIITHHGHIDLLLTDVVLRGSSGLELAADIARTHPHIAVLLTSGYHEQAVSERLTGTEIPLIEKPFTAAALLRAVHTRLNADSP